MIDPIQPTLHSATGAAPSRTSALKAKAEELETIFLAEMLKTTGLGKSPEGFDGGIGEDQFSSFLTKEYAKSMVEAGGIGLSESIFRSLIKGVRT